jgi:7-cyano-7-deazaguanine synthase
MDSTAALFWAIEHEEGGHENVRALLIDYGQRHAVELHAARTIARIARVEAHLVSLPIDVIAPSLLTRPSVDMSEPSLSVVVPGRNMILLSTAAAFARSRGDDVVTIGCCADDARVFPDCRSPFLVAAQEALALGLDWPRFAISAPWVTKNKAELVRWCRGREVTWRALAASWSCYDPRVGEGPHGLIACLACPACRLRQKGFVDAGLADPALP